MPMDIVAFQSITVAMVLGVGSYILSRGLKIPAILFYLVGGLLVGKVGLGLIDPEALGNGLHVLLEIVVAIILFEGGLSLSFRSFKSDSKAIRRMLVVTLSITGVCATLLSHFILDLSWQFAVFFGALIVVTGPTVVGSILKSVYLPRRLEILLNWESIWGDVIGVLVSAIALEIVELNLSETYMEVGGAFLLRIAGGIGIGMIGGFLLAKAFGLISRLRDPTLLGIASFTGAIVIFYLANSVLHSSGPLAVAIAGFYLSNSRCQYLHEIRHFKEQISSLFISTMFVLLSASVNPLPLVRLWPAMILVALILGAVIRPVSVLIALMKTTTTLKERLFIGLIGPRGIIAVATVAYASLVLVGHDAEMSIVMNLTFTIIFFSGLMATLSCRPLAKVLSIQIPISQSGILIVGINPLSSALAQFASTYVPVSFMETDITRCRLAGHLGLETFCTDLLDADVYEDAFDEGFGRLLATTRNDALNELIASKASTHLEPKKVFCVPPNSDEETIKMVITNHHNTAFSDGFSLKDAVKGIEQGKAALQLINPEEIEDRRAIPMIEVVDNGKGLMILTPGAIPKNESLCLVSVA
ncbi:MAG: sodium:proton antiporter [Proteobacteria bacterium]|nr:sodium:proton antiporter [Pseudomonadota bacterium]